MNFTTRLRCDYSLTQSLRWDECLVSAGQWRGMVAGSQTVQQLHEVAQRERARERGAFTLCCTQGAPDGPGSAHHGRGRLASVATVASRSTVAAGGLGLLLAHEMVRRGARTVVVVDLQQQSIEVSWRRSGATRLTARCKGGRQQIAGVRN